MSYTTIPASDLSFADAISATCTKNKDEMGQPCLIPSVLCTYSGKKYHLEIFWNWKCCIALRHIFCLII